MIGWYLLLISVVLFGKDFVYVMFGVFVFNLFGIVGGFLLLVVGCCVGLCCVLVFGFVVVCVMLVVFGLFYVCMLLWLLVVVLLLFILFYLVGFGVNGKSLLLLLFCGELCVGVNGIVGVFGLIGVVFGLLVFLLFCVCYGFEYMFLIFVIVLCVVSVICFVICWDLICIIVNFDNEFDVLYFGDDGCVMLVFLKFVIEKM